ncbi:hypothetical protein GGS23DRAFT_613649, partial [Durotheca rogersii]|uniref:uncharacterized protein n=1 Tax=Durotheca rogersii TaxID=419775 RepID=UPI002220AE8E
VGEVCLCEHVSVPACLYVCTDLLISSLVSFPLLPWLRDVMKVALLYRTHGYISRPSPFTLPSLPFPRPFWISSRQPAEKAYEAGIYKPNRGSERERDERLRFRHPRVPRHNLDSELPDICLGARLLRHTPLSASQSLNIPGYIGISVYLAPQIDPTYTVDFGNRLITHTPALYTYIDYRRTRTRGAIPTNQRIMPRTKNHRSKAGGELLAVTAVIREAYGEQRTGPGFFGAPSPPARSLSLSPAPSADEGPAELPAHPFADDTPAADDSSRDASPHRWQQQQEILPEGATRRRGSNTSSAGADTQREAAAVAPPPSSGGGGFISSLMWRLRTRRAARQTRIVASGWDAMRDPRVPQAAGRDDYGNLYLSAPWAAGDVLGLHATAAAADSDGEGEGEGGWDDDDDEAGARMRRAAEMVQIGGSLRDEIWRAALGLPPAPPPRPRADCAVVELDADRADAFPPNYEVAIAMAGLTCERVGGY